MTNLIAIALAALALQGVPTDRLECLFVEPWEPRPSPPIAWQWGQTNIVPSVAQGGEMLARFGLRDYGRPPGLPRDIVGYARFALPSTLRVPAAPDSLRVRDT
jgi:hypothetical protein